MPRQGKSDHLNIVQDISSKLGLPVITPHNMHFCDHQGGSKYCGFNRSVGERTIEPIPEDDPPTPHQRPLARMLGRIQAHMPRENIYTSLSSDYRSFQHQDSFDKVISDLSNSSSFGMDIIDTKVIKLIKPEIVPALTHIGGGT